MLTWSVFVRFFQKCLFVIIVIHSYFIYNILQGSVETHLRCGGKYNHYITASCLQSVPMKEF